MAQEPILLLFSESVPWGQVLGWVLDIQGIYFSIYLKGREMGRGDRERGGKREKKKREKRKDGELLPADSSLPSHRHLAKAYSSWASTRQNPGL